MIDCVRQGHIKGEGIVLRYSRSLSFKIESGEIHIIQTRHSCDETLCQRWVRLSKNRKTINDGEGKKTDGETWSGLS